MKFIQHDDEFVLVPQHISIYGVYSGHIIWVAILYSFYDNYTSLGYMLFLLYITTILNWYKIYHKGIIKNIDICLVLCVLLKVSLHDSLRWGANRYIWFYSIFIIISIFIINQFIFYNKIYNKKSILYCPVNTMSRENAYYINAFIHIFFIHFLLNFIGGYCAVMVYYTNPLENKNDYGRNLIF